MEPSLEKSTELAATISKINMVLQMDNFDLDYAKMAQAKFAEQASWQESVAVLNPNHSQTKNDILRMGSKQLGALIAYVEAGRKVDELKKKAKGEDFNMDQIRRMFM